MRLVSIYRSAARHFGVTQSGVYIDYKIMSLILILECRHAFPQAVNKLVLLGVLVEVF